MTEAWTMPKHVWGIRPPEPLAKAVLARARRQGKTVEEVVLEALEAWMMQARGRR